MAVRDFRDEAGRAWRAWEVAPDDLDVRTKDEDYLASLYYTGWIVFETVEGTEKRRLYPIPRGWSELPDPELEVLLNKAEVVPPRKLRGERLRGDAAAKEVDRAHAFTERAVDRPDAVREIPKHETPDVTDLRVMRTFRYPGGRMWAVGVTEDAESGGTDVLRFSAGSRHVDLRDWPKDWPDYPEEDLVGLLRAAWPRDRSKPPAPGSPRRRWDDGVAGR
jgi:hypothetical protein